jgi:hypothetical protein
MTIEERFERTETNLDRLTQVTASIAASVAAHDDQIEKLLLVAERNHQEWEQLRREFQAYLTTIHPKQ